MNCRIALACAAFLLCGFACDRNGSNAAKPASTPGQATQPTADEARPADTYERVGADVLQTVRGVNAILAEVDDVAEAKAAEPKLRQLAATHEALAARAAALGRPSAAEERKLALSVNRHLAIEGNFTRAHWIRIKDKRPVAEVLSPALKRFGAEAERIREAILIDTAAGVSADFFALSPRGLRPDYSIVPMPESTYGSGDFSLTYAHNALPLIQRYGVERVAVVEVINIASSAAASIPDQLRAAAPAAGATDAIPLAEEGRDSWTGYLLLAPIDDLDGLANSLPLGRLTNVNRGKRIITMEADGKAFPRPRQEADDFFADGTARVTLRDGMRHVISTPEKLFDLVLIPASGTVAAIDPGRDSIRFYPKLMSDGDLKFEERKVGMTPCSVVHKRIGEKGYILVLCAGDSTVHVLDDVKFELVGKVQLTSERVIKLAVSESPDSRLAFYASLDGDSKRRGIGQLSLDTFKDLWRIDAQQNEIGDLALSADGSILYGRRTGERSTGMWAFRLETSSNNDALMRATLVRSVNEETRCLQPDPFGQYFSTGDILYRANLSKPVGKLSGQALRFLQGKPVFFAADQQKVYAISYNTLMTLDTVDVPVPLTQAPSDVPQRSSQRPAFSAAKVGETHLPYAPRILADEQRGLVFVWRERQGAVIPMAAMKLGNEPYLVADVEGDADVVLGRDASVVVKKHDPATKLALRGAPAGMKLDGDTITWKPTPAQLGITNVDLQLSAAGLERTQSITFNVRRPFVDLGFVPNQLTLSPDGKRLLAAQMERNDGGQKNECRLAIVDLATLAVVSSRVLPAACAQVALDAKYAYVSLRDADAFYVLSAADLSDVKRTFTKGRVMSFRTIGNRLLFVQTPSREDPAVLRVPELTPVQLAELKPLANYAREPGNPVRVRNGWAYDGVVYDDDFAHVTMLIAPDGFPAFVEVASNVDRIRAIRDTRDLVHPMGSWGYTASRQQNSLQLGTPDYAALEDHPCVVVLETPEGNNRTPQESDPARWDLSVPELLTGTTVGAKVALLEVPGGEWRSNTNRWAQRKVMAGPSFVIVQLGTQLRIVLTAELPVKQAGVPLHFEMALNTKTLDPETPTVITPKIRGGKGPIEFSLPVEHPALSIDKSTGKLTIQPNAFKLDEIAGNAWQATTRNLPATMPADARRGVAEHVRTIAPRFKALVGREPTGIPIAVHFSINARDAENQNASLGFALFAEVPVETILKRLEEINDQQRKAQEEARRNFEQQRKRFEAQRPASPTTRPAPDVDSLIRRINELESQLQSQKQTPASKAAPKNPATGQPAPAPME